MTSDGKTVNSLNIVFTGERNVELRSEPTEPLAPNQILLETTTSMISTGSECRFLCGVSSGAVAYPYYPGYSNIAKVVAIGSGVTNFTQGDRVYHIAGHKQYNVANADADDVVALPDDADDEDAVWTALAFITQTAVRRAELAMGETAVIIGQGPIGQLVTQYLNLSGAGEVLAVDLDDDRLMMSGRHGATNVFRGSAIDAVEFVKTHTSGQLADVVFEVSGHTDVFPQALKLIKDFGKCVLVSGVEDPTDWRLVDDVQKRQLTIVGTYNHKLPAAQSFWTRTEQIMLFLKYIRQGRIKVKDLITHRFKPSQAQEAYAMLLENRSGTCGVLFDWRDLPQ
jgi:2-desacetyl-2-hydroxyethyl bacteriochlorophyllide A dehydrogenase